MTETTRQKLSKATDELIESFIKFDKTKAMQLQVGLYAIHNAQKHIDPEKKINLYAVCNYDMLHNLLEEHGISRIEFEKIPAIIQSSRHKSENFEGLSEPLQEALLNLYATHKPNYEVPTHAMVAVMFNMVKEKVKNALIAGQAGESTLKAIERVTTISHLPASKELALKDTLYDYGNKKRLARSYIGTVTKEPDYLISAKATHHLADLFEKSIQLHPESRELDSIAKSMHSFNKLAACIFHHAADNLRVSSAPDAAKKIRALADHVAAKTINEAYTDKACDIVSSGMEILRQAMKENGIITEQEAEDYKELVNKRIDQIRKMEMV